MRRENQDPRKSQSCIFSPWQKRNIVAGFYLGSNLNGIGFESQVVHGSKGRALQAHVVSYLDSGIDSCSIRSKIEGLPDLQP